jgi:hypothetical protein
MKPIDILNLKIGQVIYHKTLKNADGSAMRARVNGKTKFWKTRPNDFKTPMKYGMYNCFYLTPSNQYEWQVNDI